MLNKKNSYFKSFFKSLSEQDKQLLIKMFLYEEYNKQFLEKIHEDDKDAISRCFPAMTFVTERELKAAKEEPEYIEILNLFKKSKEQGKLDKSLVKIFYTNKKQAIRLLRIRRGKLIRNILGKQFKNYQMLKKQSKLDICNKILDDRLKTATTEEKQIYNIIEREIEEIENDEALPFLSLSDSMLQAKVGKSKKYVDILEYYSFIVYNPTCQSLGFMFTDDKWQNFPFKWLFNEIAIVTTRELFLLHKENKDISFYFILFYTKI